jgi:hypothetical protein
MNVALETYVEPEELGRTNSTIHLYELRRHPSGDGFTRTIPRA